MRFDERDRGIDVENDKSAFRWICRHDISHSKPNGLVKAFRKLIMGLFVGDRFGWQGVDVFHFDGDGKIKGKFTYGWFGDWIARTFSGRLGDGVLGGTRLGPAGQKLSERVYPNSSATRLQE